MKSLEVQLLIQMGRSKLLQVHHVDMDDITGTIQMKYAIEKGATEITTVGFDCLKNRLNKHINWTWTKPSWK